MGALRKLTALLLERKRTAQRGFIVGLGFVLLGAFSASSEPLVLHDMDGHSYDVDQLIAAGHPVVLVFWQTWCPSCRREAPALARAIAQHGDDLQFFGVVSGPNQSVDDAKVRRVAKEWGHTQPQIRDRDLSVTQRFNVHGTPVIIVLGSHGRELYRGHRLPSDWTPYLGSALAEKFLRHQG